MTPFRTNSRAPIRTSHPALLAAAAAALTLTAVTAAPLATGAAAQPAAIRPAVVAAPAATTTKRSATRTAELTVAERQVQYVRLLAFAVAVQRARYARTLAFAVAVEQAREHAAAAPPVPYGGVWDELAGCESGGNWAINTGMFDGGLQFLPSTWRAYGGGQFAPYAFEASRDQQIAVAERVLAATGNNFRASWPACSRKLGL